MAVLGALAWANDDVGAIRLFMCQSDFPSIKQLSHTYCAPGALQAP